VDLRNRKTLILFWLFNLANALIVVPLLLSPPSRAVWRILILLVGVAFPLAATVIHWSMAGILLRLARHAVRRADYDRALLLTGRMRVLARHEFRGAVLALAGRPKEAEEVLARLAWAAGDPKQRAKRLTLLAEVLMDQGMWEQSKDMLEEAIGLDIGTGSPCTVLASWYLQQGIESQQALDLVERANAAPGLAALKPSVRNGILALRLANKAVALARLGRHCEAESAIIEAFGMADAESLPGAASLHWHVCMAFAGMGRLSEAREHAQRASAVDPCGKYGHLAVRWLEIDRRNSTA
jgi:tetratricopeptide (TPR) repeat protein